MEFWRYRNQPDGQARQAMSAPAFGQVSGPPDSRVAFEKGLREGRTAVRHRRHGHPVLTIVVVLMAIVGAAALALAAREGSFSRGGAVVDRKLAVAADRALVTVADDAVKARRAVTSPSEGRADRVSDAAPQH